MTFPSLVEHPIWSVLVAYVRAPAYDRDGGHADPRHRIEVTNPDNGILVRHFLGATMRCVSCGAEIHPVRQREGEAVSLYIAVTCALDVRYACARSGAARDEYRRIIAAVEGWTDPRQRALFEEVAPDA